MGKPLKSKNKWFRNLNEGTSEMNGRESYQPQPQDALVERLLGDKRKVQGGTLTDLRQKIPDDTIRLERSLLAIR
jgi:hypothetical protein